MEKKREILFLHSDLLENILSRIPAKRLLQWRLVSRSWRSLIDETLNPLPFLLMYPYTIGADPVILRFRDHKKEEGKLARRFIGLDPSIINFLPRNPRQISYACHGIIACSNGLLLCHLECRRFGVGGSYCVCNPATKTWEVLPDPPQIYPPQIYCHWFRMLLAFDPHRSPHYKVVLIFNRSVGITTMFSLVAYSSEDKKWGELKSFPNIASLSSRRSTSSCYNGDLYVCNERVVVRIDYSMNNCREIALPDSVTLEKYKGLFHIGMLGGSLCCAELNGHQIKVWKLMDDDETWVLKHINKDAMAAKFTYDIYHIKAFHPRSDIVLVLGGTTLSFYNIRRSNLEHVCQLAAMIKMPCIDENTMELKPVCTNFGFEVQPFWPCFS